jgi:hypothetical protein
MPVQRRAYEPAVLRRSNAAFNTTGLNPPTMLPRNCGAASTFNAT